MNVKHTDLKDLISVIPLCYKFRLKQNKTHQSRTNLFNEWRPTMLHVSISKELSLGNLYKNSKTYQFYKYLLHSRTLCFRFLYM